MNYYDTLGVERDATDAGIKKAYRKLASAHHPDKGGDEDKFKKIKEAYEGIKDNDSRDSYNYQDRSNEDHTYKSYHGNDYDDDWPETWRDKWQDRYSNYSDNAHRNPFEDLLKERPRRESKTPIHINLSIDLESTLYNQTRTIKLTEHGGAPIQITVPQGVQNQQLIRYPGIVSNNDNYYKRDLNVTFHILPHKLFEVVANINLVTHVKIDALAAIVGSDVTVQTIDGTTLKVKMASGTQPGTKLKIPNKGLPVKDSGAFGHLYVEIDITIPKLNEDQIEIINNLMENKLWQNKQM